MLSKNKIKFVQSLSMKKNRDRLGLFIAEGEKLIQQLCTSGFKLNTLITTKEKLKLFQHINCELIEATPSEIKKISLLKTPQDVFAICSQRIDQLEHIDLKKELILSLDDIQDPGNLGTIIRLASWFGIKNIVCSTNTVDCYNPKVIQSTMGAIAQVSIHYTDLESFIKTARQKEILVYGTFLEGENIYQTTLQQCGIVVLGNEGKGISPLIAPLIDQKLLIPSFEAQGNQVESLNVSMATSIICSEFKRRSL
jgi:TrmH family RNA methyltransferase